MFKYIVNQNSKCQALNITATFHNAELAIAAAKRLSKKATISMVWVAV